MHGETEIAAAEQLDAHAVAVGEAAEHVQHERVEAEAEQVLKRHEMELRVRDIGHDDELHAFERHHHSHRHEHAGEAARELATPPPRQEKQLENQNGPAQH